MNEVKLVWATPDGDALVARLARVSNPANQDNPDSASLIRYLLKHQHWSPLEMISMCVEINTTRDIGRQILRHRSFSFQEFSQRYADVGALAAPLELRECRMQDPKNRQNSLENAPEHLVQWWNDAQEEQHEASWKVYQQALDAGIAKEQARSLLPEGLTPSRMYMSGTLRSWVHYVNLRTDPSTQKEHRQIAAGCRSLVYEHFPRTAVAAWRDSEESA